MSLLWLSLPVENSLQASCHTTKLGEFAWVWFQPRLSFGFKKTVLLWDIILLDDKYSNPKHIFQIQPFKCQQSLPESWVALTVKDYRNTGALPPWCAFSVQYNVGHNRASVGLPEFLFIWMQSTAKNMTCELKLTNVCLTFRWSASATARYECQPFPQIEAATLALI